MKKTFMQDLKQDLKYYEKELEEYHTGTSDSYTRDLENTIDDIKKELEEITLNKMEITNKTLTALNNQMSLVREVLERYTEDEAGEEQKEKYAHMSDDEIITLLTNTLMTCSNYEDFETDLIINFDYSNY